ncbi:helix-turn-helix domain-containing protein [Sediminicola luteus]|uniref:HTH araC/xylS-type domain-containing protein n=1 Tax=Sediminicola luteus TaxID=319238 RepID=A0A2A4GA70_9FLAO|nr:AraC family transcriptional regulator [Sediminicola luteus]PCE64874.1 hypothetical protein B7P33_06830 [Sediminicola luteus]
MDYQTEIIEGVGKMAVFLMLLLSVFLLTVKTKNKLANRLFSIYLLVIAFDLTGFFTTLPLNYPITKGLKIASSLLQLPLFYLYVNAACYSNFNLKTKHLWHALPFLIFIILFWIFDFAPWSATLFQWTTEVQFPIYIIAIFLKLKSFKKVHLENYSGPGQITYKWLFQITLLSCIAHTFVLARWLFSNNSFYEYVPTINLIISLSVLSVTTFFVLKALYQPDLFKGVDMNLRPSQTKLNNDSGKTGSISNENLSLLNSFMEKEKPYLDYELTLQKLAGQMNTPERELSSLINQQLGKHFFDFINEYRIRDAQALLKDPSQKKMTILEVLYAVGFNSKSSFYTAFKKVTNQTPTAYRKSNL